MRIFLICPVRYASEEQTTGIARYVLAQEQVEGNVVHWPARDTMQNQGSLKVCEDNRFAMEHADEVHVWYDPNSQGSLFDLGMAFAMGKPVVLVNKTNVPATPGKSFGNFILSLDQKYWELRQPPPEYEMPGQGGDITFQTMIDGYDKAVKEMQR
jgi:nucleoside 2-deoxyribosyltransferase